MTYKGFPPFPVLKAGDGCGNRSDPNGKNRLSNQAVQEGALSSLKLAYDGYINRLILPTGSQLRRSGGGFGGGAKGHRQ
jgi:hypothetical protein